MRISEVRRGGDRRHGGDGASALEFGLLVGLLAALIVVVVVAFGGVIKDVFDDEPCRDVATAAPGAPTPDCKPS